MTTQIGQLSGCAPWVSSLALVTWFQHKIIWSKKKSYLSTSISLHIAWYPLIHTLVCSATDKLKNQPWLSMLISSGKAAGLQFSWQKTWVSLCFDLKWKTSTLSPMVSKYGSDLMCCTRAQLLLKKRWSSLIASIQMVCLMNSCQWMEHVISRTLYYQGKWDLQPHLQHLQCQTWCHIRISSHMVWLLVVCCGFVDRWI